MRISRSTRTGAPSSRAANADWDSSPTPNPERSDGRSADRRAEWPVSCAECDDSGFDEAGDTCSACPLCAGCAERLALRADTAIALPGWDSFCSFACLSDDAERWSQPARARLALAWLDAEADGFCDDHPESRELAAYCREELGETIRALVVRPRAGERSARRSAGWEAAELALLAGREHGRAVVERRCPECDDAVAERFVDASAISGAEGSEIALCDWHAHIEAMRIVQRRQPARSVRPSDPDARPAEEPERARA